MGIVATPSVDTQVTMGHDQAAFEKMWSLYTGGHKDMQVSLYNKLTKLQEGVIDYCIA